jgi:hypothetical protein
MMILLWQNHWGWFMNDWVSRFSPHEFRKMRAMRLRWRKMSKSAMKDFWGPRLEARSQCWKKTRGMKRRSRCLLDANPTFSQVTQVTLMKIFLPVIIWKIHEHPAFIDDFPWAFPISQVWAEKDGKEGWILKTQLVKKLPPWQLQKAGGCGTVMQQFLWEVGSSW